MKIDINDQIEKLQKQPYEVRVKILWAVVAVSAIILLAIWFLSLRHTFGNLNAKNLVQAPTSPAGQSSVVSSTQYVAVEWVEKTNTSLQIYFNINNPSNDILNISKFSDISLDVNGNALAPKQMLDRQGKPFVQKVLSHTKNFGILTFAPIDGDSGKLTFDQMFLDGSPTNFFKQSLNLDFNKLNDSTKVRN